MGKRTENLVNEMNNLESVYTQPAKVDLTLLMNQVEKANYELKTSPILPVYNESKPTSLKNNWITESKEDIKYYGNPELITNVFKSKGKSIKIMVNGDIVGVRNFSPYEATMNQSHIEYLTVTKDQQLVLFSEKGEKERINLVCSLLAGSTGIFGKSFLDCKNPSGKSGRYIAKVNQKEISNKLESLLNTVKKV